MCVMHIVNGKKDIRQHQAALDAQATRKQAH